MKRLLRKHERQCKGTTATPESSREKVKYLPIFSSVQLSPLKIRLLRSKKPPKGFVKREKKTLSKPRHLCEVCGSVYYCPEELKGHLISTHSTLNGQCSLCGKTVRNVIEHEKAHALAELYQCPVTDCRLGFYIGSGKLANHLLNHHRKQLKDYGVDSGCWIKSCDDEVGQFKCWQSGKRQ